MGLGCRAPANRCPLRRMCFPLVDHRWANPFSLSRRIRQSAKVCPELVVDRSAAMSRPEHRSLRLWLLHPIPMRQRWSQPPIVRSTATAEPKLSSLRRPQSWAVPASVSGTGNIAGANVAERAFSSEAGSILSTGLKSKAAVSTQPQISAASALKPSAVAAGEGHASADGAPWQTITPRIYSAPTVQLGTTGSATTTPTSSATGH